MSEIEIACANFTRAMNKYAKIMASRSKDNSVRDTYKAKTKGVSNGKVYRTFRTVV